MDNKGLEKLSMFYVHLRLLGVHLLTIICVPFLSRWGVHLLQAAGLNKSDLSLSYSEVISCFQKLSLD